MVPVQYWVNEHRQRGAEARAERRGADAQRGAEVAVERVIEGRIAGQFEDAPKCSLGFPKARPVTSMVT